jgi:hypothetical protein
MSVYARRMNHDIKEIVNVRPLSYEEALAAIEECRDPVFKPFARQIYTETYNNFQTQNSKVRLGFRQASGRSPIFMIKNANGPVSIAELPKILMNPPPGIKVEFPTIDPNADRTLNIEFKYELNPIPVSRPRSLSPRRDVRSRSRSHSHSPQRRNVNKLSPERPPKKKVKSSSSASDDIVKKPPRRSQSVQRETRPKARSKSRGRSTQRKIKSSSSSEEEPKKGGGLFGLW